MKRCDTVQFHQLVRFDCRNFMRCEFNYDSAMSHGWVANEDSQIFPVNWPISLFAIGLIKAGIPLNILVHSREHSFTSHDISTKRHHLSFIQTVHIVHISPLPSPSERMFTVMFGIYRLQSNHLFIKLT